MTDEIINDDFLSKAESFSKKESSEDIKQKIIDKQPKEVTEAEEERERLRNKQKSLKNSEIKHEINNKWTEDVPKKETEKQSVENLEKIVKHPVANTTEPVVKEETIEFPKEEHKIVPMEEKPIEKEPVVQESIKEEETVVEEKPVETPKEIQKDVPVKHEIKSEDVHIVNATEYEQSLVKSKNDKTILKNVDIVDDMDKSITESNQKILTEDSDEDENSEDSSFNNFLGRIYADDDENNKSTVEPEIVVVSDKNKASEEKTEESEPVKEETEKPEVSSRPDNVYGNGDGNQSFKLRSSKMSKILKNIKIEDTNNVEPVDISKKPINEQQSLYIDTILPTLKPSYSVTPMIISGVVITMTAFGWPDIREICKIEEKIDETLDPSDDDYIYQKNKLFLEKRRKQIDIFYKHIYSVSGYPVKPAQDDLFRNILKFPDFQQLFFAAYSASFQKPYEFSITCGTCGTEQTRMISAKQLCYLLNKNISVDRLNSIISKGSMISSDNESLEVYKEFQNENIVIKSNKLYRTKQPLPNTGIIVNLKIPSIYDALDTMDEIVETFKDKPLEVTDDNGNTVAIDYSFGLNEDLTIFKYYLYMNSIIVANPKKDKDNPNRIEVTYFEFKDKQSIINTIYNLTGSDYKALLSDENLNNIVKVRGITHAIEPGKCENTSCGIDLGTIKVEPETLFFIIAKQESID